MLELWQTEWCPSSRRVRERMTELGVDYLIHQVPADPDGRGALVRETGARSIPVLKLGSGDCVVGEQAIREHLDEHYPEPPEAQAHRTKAAKAHARLLREECR